MGALRLIAKDADSIGDHADGDGDCKNGDADDCGLNDVLCNQQSAMRYSLVNGIVHVFA